MLFRRSTRAAFTLIELLVVLGIIAIMAVMAVSLTSNTLPSVRLNQGSRDIMLATQLARARAVRTGRPYKICIYSNAATAFTTQGGFQLLGCRPGNSCNDPANDYPVCKNTAQGYDTAKVGAGKAWDVPSQVLPINGLGSPLSDSSRIFESKSVGYPGVNVSATWTDSTGATFTTATGSVTGVVEIEFTPYGLVDPNTTSSSATGLLAGITLTNQPTSSSTTLTRTMIIDQAGGVRIQ